VHRLARLIGRQGAIVQKLVAVALYDMALRAGAAVLHEGQLSSDELREIRQFLMQLSPPCNVRRSIGTFERFMILDILANGARGAVEVLGPEVSGVLLATRIDWNIPLRLANDWFDKITAATDPTTVFEREAALTQVEEELKALMANSRTPHKIAGALVSSTKRSELAGEIMLSMFLPAIRSVQQAEDRATAKLRLLQVASALAIHRAQSGEYPAALEDLAVDLRGELPTDPYSGNAFLYEKRGEGYVLWSLGGNLADDKASGKQFHITVGGEAAADDAVQDHQDDIVLRAPWAE
jgi:hypothetical protein